MAISETTKKVAARVKSENEAVISRIDKEIIIKNQEIADLELKKIALQKENADLSNDIPEPAAQIP